MSEDSPRPDQIPGAPHPRDTVHLFGQAAAETAFLEAHQSNRMHHGWLLTGPRGVGKATLAYRIARFLLTTPPQDEDGLFGAPPPPESLEVSPEHPVAQRIRAGSEPGLRVVTRSENDQGRMRAEIVVDDIRKLAEFFHLSAADGGRRVVIVDAADDMNVSAANALLKMLEEPPEATTLLLLAHQPSRLLPTIRSRCRTLRLAHVSPDDMQAALHQIDADPGDVDPTALAELSGGSVGGAMRLLNLSGLGIYSELVTLLGSMPQLDRARARALADAAAQRGAEAKLDLLIDLLDTALARLARTGAAPNPMPPASPNETQVLQRLSPDAHAARLWADRAAATTARLRHGRAVNLDPAVLVLDTLLKLNETARDIAARAPA